jgi:hypothetical protein
VKYDYSEVCPVVNTDATLLYTGYVFRTIRGINVRE